MERRRAIIPAEALRLRRRFVGSFFFLTEANMSHLSGGQLIREALAKVRVLNMGRVPTGPKKKKGKKKWRKPHRSTSCWRVEILRL